MNVNKGQALVVDIEPRRNSRPICPQCRKRCNIYDRQPQRLFESLPILSFKVYYRYAPRRVNCPDHGVKVESMRKFNEAIDEIRRSEVIQFKANGQENILERGRWLLLKRPENLSEKQTSRLDDLMKLNLASLKGYLLREDFQRFWEYQRPDFAGTFLDNWVTRTLQTDLKPMKQVAKMLRNHKPMILNWFKA